WNTAKVTTPATLAPGSYWLAYLPSSDALAFRKAPISNGAPNSRYYSYAFGTLPATFSATPSTTSSHWSLYATLNVASTVVIGEPNVLSQNDDGNANLLVAQQATLGQSATLQSLSFYVTTAAGSLILGVYDATGPGGGPGAKKAETA